MQLASGASQRTYKQDSVDNTINPKKGPNPPLRATPLEAANSYWDIRSPDFWPQQPISQSVMLVLSQVSAMTRVISKSALPYSPATAAGHCLMEAATSSELLQQNLMQPSLLALPETFRRM